MLLRKHPVILFLAMCLLALVAWGFWPQALLVELVQVERSPMMVTIEEEGRTRVIDRYVVSAPVNGVASRLQYDIGDPVRQGEVLLHITSLHSQVLDPRAKAQAKAEVAGAESALRVAHEEVRAAQAKQKRAATELERLRPLLEKGVISRDAFDRVVAEASTTAAVKRSAEFNVEVASYELEAAQALLEYTYGVLPEGERERVPVTSPVNGKILSIIHQCEGPVVTGEALLEVGNPAALEIEVDVLSADAVKLSEGMNVQFVRWGGDQPLSGVVRVVEPVGFTKVSALGVEEQRVLVISDLTSDESEWNRLGDGYRVEAKFIIWHEEDVMQIPVSSLFRHRGGWAVFVASNDRAELRAIETGQQNGLQAQIIRGLREGEQVVDHPSREIENGTRIKQRSAGHNAAYE